MAATELQQQKEQLHLAVDKPGITEEAYLALFAEFRIVMKHMNRLVMPVQHHREMLAVSQMTKTPMATTIEEARQIRRQHGFTDKQMVEWQIKHNL